MNELVFLKNRQALTTSLKVAEYFDKRHDNVIQAIEREYGDLLEFKEMFRAATYPDKYGRRQKMYYMNRAVVRAIEDSIAQLEGVRKNAYTPPFLSKPRTPTSKTGKLTLKEILA